MFRATVSFGGNFEANFPKALELATTRRNYLRLPQRILFHKYINNDQSVISLHSIGNYNQVTVATSRQFADLSSILSSIATNDAAAAAPILITFQLAEKEPLLPAGFYHSDENTISYGMTPLFLRYTESGKTTERRFATTTMSNKTLSEIVKTLECEFFKREILLVGYEIDSTLFCGNHINDLMLSEIVTPNFILCLSNI